MKDGAGTFVLARISWALAARGQSLCRLGCPEYHGYNQLQVGYTALGMNDKYYHDAFSEKMVQHFSPVIPRLDRGIHLLEIRIN
jgi:hypothetical protein